MVVAQQYQGFVAVILDGVRRIHRRYLGQKKAGKGGSLMKARVEFLRFSNTNNCKIENLISVYNY